MTLNQAWSNKSSPFPTEEAPEAALDWGTSGVDSSGERQPEESEEIPNTKGHANQAKMKHQKYLSMVYICMFFYIGGHLFVLFPNVDRSSPSSKYLGLQRKQLYTIVSML